MSQKTGPEPVSFEKIWKDAGEYGAGIEDLARELYQNMIEAKVPIERIRIAIRLLREIKNMDDYFTETFAEIAQVKSLEKKLRLLINKHEHGDSGVALLPIENVESAKET